MNTPEIMYSDVEVTAKIVMDPRTMQIALSSIQELFDKTHGRGEYDALVRLCDEMRRVLSRLSDMNLI